MLCFSAITELLAACDDAPEDNGRKLVAADAAAEAGDEALERGLRWCAKNGKWPDDTYLTGLYDWWSREVAALPHPEYAYIPYELYHALASKEGNIRDHRQFGGRTRDRDSHALVRWLGELVG